MLLRQLPSLLVTTATAAVIGTTLFASLWESDSSKPPRIFPKELSEKKDLVVACLYHHETNGYVAGSARPFLGNREEAFHAARTYLIEAITEANPKYKGSATLKSNLLDMGCMHNYLFVGNDINALDYWLFKLTPDKKRITIVKGKGVL